MSLKPKHPSLQNNLGKLVVTGFQDPKHYTWQTSFLPNLDLTLPGNRRLDKIEDARNGHPLCNQLPTVLNSFNCVMHI
ncbi:hypothetical protein PHLCEN_2v2664 [Hermanssonia centrifuga]|uniref:Uncharacterized protein n=1 Tax=Hermanssonia centrifuga TaxID=98765 RepID=A0A2R6RIH5_9APHY|nr:hypothetical protein PHLCEN_2v2664 [Hermanssonia centrifuga]